MKLRNKKTGEIVRVCPIYVQNCGEYNSLAELNEELEDYKPAEPLIKDPKVRIAVRAWAEANNYSLVSVGYSSISDTHLGNTQIHFDTKIMEESKYGIYTIAELCGDEEE